MKKTQKRVIAAGAGLAAVAAAAAGVYLLTGKNAKNRKKLAKWAGDMQNDVVKELNKAGKHTKANYQQIVDKVAKNYKNLKNVSAPELAQVASELKSHWDIISNEVGKASAVVKQVVPTAKKTVKKTAKKAVKKAVKKARR
jgi:HPt (histidine-containing phosphotransfer) domain-containing protein